MFDVHDSTREPPSILLGLLFILAMGFFGLGLAGLGDGADVVEDSYNAVVQQSSNSDPFGLKVYETTVKLVQPRTNSGVTEDTAAYQAGSIQTWQDEWNGNFDLPIADNSEITHVTDWDGSLDIPLSNHAISGHNGAGKWNAERIRDLMQRRVCRPIDTFVCTQNNNYHIKAICPIGDFAPTLWAGLIIGLQSDSPIIVTAYIAPLDYWMKSVRRDECVTGIYLP